MEAEAGRMNVDQKKYFEGVYSSREPCASDRIDMVYKECRAKFAGEYC